MGYYLYYKNGDPVGFSEGQNKDVNATEVDFETYNSYLNSVGITYNPPVNKEELLKNKIKELESQILYIGMMTEVL